MYLFPATPAPRIIGLRVRILKTTEGEPSPTQVAIMNADGSGLERMDLKDQQAEVDFIAGELPTAFKAVDVLGADSALSIAGLPKHHVEWKKVAEGVEVPWELAAAGVARFVKKGKTIVGHEVITKVPTAFTGLRSGDRVAMNLGGTGDLVARDIADFGVDTDIKVFRITPGVLKDEREARCGVKNDDSVLLATLLQEGVRRFYDVRPQDFNVIALGLSYTGRQEAQQQRIRMGNRLTGEARHTLLRSKRSANPIDSLETAFTAAKAHDRNFQRFLAEEKAAEQEFAELLLSIPLWVAIQNANDTAEEAGRLKPWAGVGPVTGAGIISGIGDIRRFIVEPDADALKALEAERHRLITAGEYSDGKELLGAAALAGMNGFDRVVAVRKYFRTEGLTVQTEFLTQALVVMKSIKALKDKAFTKGESRFVKYCGLHVQPDGTFPRHTPGSRSDWDDVIRQRFYILMDVFNKAPGSIWGTKLVTNKMNIRAKHPVVVMVQFVKKMKDGKKVTLNRPTYTPLHTLLMAKWRTATQFARAIYKLWVSIETGKKGT